MTDHSKLNRRRFLQGSAVAAGGLLLPASVLAACGDGVPSYDKGSGTLLKLARPDKPITLSTVGDPIGNGLTHESGTLQILNWVDYLNP
ncbi:uncharacterized protein METZ01_LOCUS288764, partial [marine metagenome]